MPKRATTSKPAAFDERFIRSVTLDLTEVTDRAEFPWSVPAIRTLGAMKKGLDLHPRVTYIIGENGTGKSTLIEGIAACAGFGEHGGSKFLRQDAPDWSPLFGAMRLIRGIRRERDGFFLRAESFYNVASRLTDIANDGTPAGRSILSSYGHIYPHSQSHGEWFLSVIRHRLQGGGLYVLDEPEAGLSPTRQFAFLSWLRPQVELSGSQVVIATHSPIVLIPGLDDLPAERRRHREGPIRGH